LRNLINQRDIHGNLEQTSRERGNTLNVLRMVEREYRLDTDECPVVIGSKADFPLRWI
jgi:hypothetical protein